MQQRQTPLVPIDLDLRDFRWMKLDLIALFNSDFNSTADDTAWRAGVTLWGKAWHQIPAGSLPDDDARLCNLAGLGRDMKTWKRVKEEALHGFVLCTDGRLYHKFLCGMAVEAAEERDRYARRRTADRERKAARISSGIPPDEHETGPPVPPENPIVPPENDAIPAEFHPENPIEGAERSGATEEPRSKNLRSGSPPRAVARPGLPTRAADISAEERRERWRSKMIAEAQTTMKPKDFGTFMSGMLEDPAPPWVKDELERLDRQVKRRSANGAG